MRRIRRKMQALEVVERRENATSIDFLYYANIWRGVLELVRGLNIMIQSEK